jgi:hypothetical protein
MRKVTFEKRNKNVSKVKDTINYIAQSSNTKQEAVNRLSDILSGLKFGWGGSHVWCANQNNERLFLIEGY